MQLDYASTKQEPNRAFFGAGAVCGAIFFLLMARSRMLPGKDAKANLDIASPAFGQMLLAVGPVVLVLVWCF